MSLNETMPSGIGQMTLCALFAAVLTACGGGGGGSAAADAASFASVGAGDASTGSATTADANDTTALAVKVVAETSVRIANENQNFLVAGAMTVRYGAGSSWITKQVTDAGSCTNDYFRKDPVFGTVKSCEVVVAKTTADSASVATAALPTSEGGTFYVFGTRSVRYGASGKFVTKSVTGRAECSNAFFGNDPNYGVVKSCQVATPSTVVTAEPTPVATTPTTTATTNPTTTATTTTTTAASPAATTVTTPTTPATTTLAAPVVSALMPVIDKLKIAAAATGWSSARVGPANVADASQRPNPSDIGDFREYCEFSHMSYDDPIVAPGAVGGHLHTFLGNTGTNANSTAASIANTGNSTCAGGTLNRTSYWVPSMIDTADGTPLKPQGSLIYYKQGYNYIKSTDIRAFPAGLRMIAGNSASSGPQDNTGFTCFKSDGTWTTGKSIPTDCPAGSTLTMGVAFPQCWDGVNLDSPDHKSHMAYPGIGCPATHPVPLPVVTFNINYSVTSASGTSKWRLSSDNYDKSLPGGYSTHADWFDGWNNDILTTWITSCINASMDCHAFLIGDGRTLF